MGKQSVVVQNNPLDKNGRIAPSQESTSVVSEKTPSIAKANKQTSGTNCLFVNAASSSLVDALLPSLEETAQEHNRVEHHSHHKNANTINSFEGNNTNTRDTNFDDKNANRSGCEKTANVEEVYSKTKHKFDGTNTSGQENDIADSEAFKDMVKQKSCSAGVAHPMPDDWESWGLASEETFNNGGVNSSEECDTDGASLMHNNDKKNCSAGAAHLVPDDWDSWSFASEETVNHGGG